MKNAVGVFGTRNDLQISFYRQVAWFQFLGLQQGGNGCVAGDFAGFVIDDDLQVDAPSAHAPRVCSGNIPAFDIEDVESIQNNQSTVVPDSAAFSEFRPATSKRQAGGGRRGVI